MCYEAAMKLTSSLSKKTFVAAPSASKSTEAGDTEDSKVREVETIAPDVAGQFSYSCLTLTSLFFLQKRELKCKKKSKLFK